MKAGHIIISAIAVAALALPLSCNMQQEEQVSLIPYAESALRDSSSVAYLHLENFPRNTAVLPIGIFDCSDDALMVLEQLLTCDLFDNITAEEKPDGIADFAGEHFQLLLDVANAPYEGYVRHARTAFLRELAVRDAAFLLGTVCYVNNLEETPWGSKNPCKIIVSVPEVNLTYGSADVRNLLKKSATGVELLTVTHSSDTLKMLDDIARRTYRSLRGNHNLALRTTEQRLEFFITEPSGQLPADAADSLGFYTDLFKYSRDDASGEVTFKQVPATFRNVDVNAIDALSERFPASSELILKSLN